MRKIKHPTSLLFTLLALGVLTALLFPATKALTDEATIDVQVREVLSLEVLTDGSHDSQAESTDSGTPIVNLTATLGATASKSVTLRAKTNEQTGLTVLASATESGSNTLNDTAENGPAYLPLAAASATLAARTVDDVTHGTWGLKVTDTTSTAYTGTYSPLPLYNSTNSNFLTVGLTTKNGEIFPTLEIAAYTPSDQIAGTYTGSILFTAVSNYRPLAVTYVLPDYNPNSTTENSGASGMASYMLRHHCSTVYKEATMEDYGWDSPANDTWGHSNCDSSIAEDIVKPYNHTGTIVTIDEADLRFDTIPADIENEISASTILDSTIVYDGSTQYYHGNAGRVFLGWTTNQEKAIQISLYGSSAYDTYMDTKSSNATTYSLTDFQPGNGQDFRTDDYLTTTTDITLYAVWHKYAIATLGLNANMNFMVVDEVYEDGGYKIYNDGDLVSDGEGSFEGTVYDIGDTITDNRGETTLIYTYYVPPVMFTQTYTYAQKYQNPDDGTVYTEATFTATETTMARYFYQNSGAGGGEDYSLSGATTRTYVTRSLTDIRNTNQSKTMPIESYWNTRNRHIAHGIENTGIEYVNFDKSFAQFKPFSTAEWFGYNGQYYNNWYDENGENEYNKNYVGIPRHDPYGNNIETGQDLLYNQISDFFGNGVYYPLVSKTKTISPSTWSAYNICIDKDDVGTEKCAATSSTAYTGYTYTTRTGKTIDYLNFQDHKTAGWYNYGHQKTKEITNFKNLNTTKLLAITEMFSCYAGEVYDPVTLDLSDFKVDISNNSPFHMDFANAGAYSSNFQIVGLANNWSINYSAYFYNWGNSRSGSNSETEYSYVLNAMIWSYNGEMTFAGVNYTGDGSGTLDLSGVVKDTPTISLWSTIYSANYATIDLTGWHLDNKLKTSLFSFLSTDHVKTIYVSENPNIFNDDGDVDADKIAGYRDLTVGIYWGNTNKNQVGQYTGLFSTGNNYTVKSKDYNGTIAQSSYYCFNIDSGTTGFAVNSLAGSSYEYLNDTSASTSVKTRQILYHTSCAFRIGDATTPGILTYKYYDYGDSSSTDNTDDGTDDGTDE